MMRKGYTIKDISNNYYVFAIKINDVVFFLSKSTVYSTKKVMEKLRDKLYIKYPTLKGRLILEKDFH